MLELDQLEEALVFFNNNGVYFYRSGCWDPTIKQIITGIKIDREHNVDSLGILDQIIFEGCDEDAEINSWPDETRDGLQKRADIAFLFYKHKAISQEEFKRYIFWLRKVAKKIEWLESYERKRLEATSVTTNQETRKRILERDGKACKNCGTTKWLVIDHIIPVCKGGGNEDENLQVLCNWCNSSKGGKLDWDGVVKKKEPSAKPKKRKMRRRSTAPSRLRASGATETE